MRVPLYVGLPWQTRGSATTCFPRTSCCPLRGRTARVVADRRAVPAGTRLFATAFMGLLSVNVLSLQGRFPRLQGWQVPSGAIPANATLIFKVGSHA